MKSLDCSKTISPPEPAKRAGGEDLSYRRKVSTNQESSSLKSKRAFPRLYDFRLDGLSTVIDLTDFGLWTLDDDPFDFSAFWIYPIDGFVYARSMVRMLENRGNRQEYRGFRTCAVRPTLPNTVSTRHTVNPSPPSFYGIPAFSAGKPASISPPGGL
jgi:hypothetical protein